MTPPQGGVDATVTNPISLTQEEKLKVLGEHIYKSIIIIFSSNASGVWVDKINRIFPSLEGMVKHCFRTKRRGTNKSLAQIGHVLNKSPLDVIDYIYKLADEPRTSTYIIMTTYQTIRKRGLRTTAELPARIQGSGKKDTGKAATAGREGDDDNY